MTTQPLQVSLGKDVWRVAVASMLLCRAIRVQAAPVLAALLARWPTAADLARASAEEVEAVVRPCGLQRNRARQLTRFSVEYLGEWTNIRDLTGVGAYVADAVAVFCFGSKEVTCGDKVLMEYVNGTDATNSASGARGVP